MKDSKSYFNFKRKERRKIKLDREKKRERGIFLKLFKCLQGRNKGSLYRKMGKKKGQNRENIRNSSKKCFKNFINDYTG